MNSLLDKIIDTSLVKQTAKTTTRKTKTPKEKKLDRTQKEVEQNNSVTLQSSLRSNGNDEKINKNKNNLTTTPPCPRSPL